MFVVLYALNTVQAGYYLREGKEREGEREEREGGEERESLSNCTILAIPKPQDLIPHRNPHISFWNSSPSPLVKKPKDTGI